MVSRRTPNPSFPWHWAHLFIAAFSPIGCRVSQHRRPLGLVLERQSSQAKDGFVESKKVSIVFRAALTAGDERAARLSPKTRTPPEPPRWGRVPGNPHLVMYEGLL